MVIFDELLSNICSEYHCEILQIKDQFIWLDMQAPQEADIALLQDECKFHPLAIEDAIRHHERPKFDA